MNYLTHWLVVHAPSATFAPRQAVAMTLVMFVARWLMSVLSFSVHRGSKNLLNMTVSCEASDKGPDMNCSVGFRG